MIKIDEPGYRPLFRFFGPLALQTMSQTLTYPLVTMVVSRGPDGPVALAGFAQAHVYMFLLGALAFGLTTTGMAFGRSREGYRKFFMVNITLMVCVAIFHLISIIPPVSHLIFGKLMGLSPTLEHHAHVTLWASLPLHMLFFLRNPFHVALYNARFTGRAYTATLGRIVLTALLSPVFSYFNLVGTIWAVVCLTIPLVLEVLISAYFSLPLIKKLPPARINEIPRGGEIIRFALTLSVGYVFLSLSSYVVSSFIARSPDPEIILPVYHVVLGIMSPVLYGTSRIQVTVLSFSGNRSANNRLLRFAMMVGFSFALLPLLSLIPGICEMYYIILQKIPLDNLPIVHGTVMAMILVPPTIALRAYGEGRAAFLKKPEIILGGQATYLGMVTVTAFFAHNLGFPGNYIGAISFVVGNLSAAGTVWLSLGWRWHNDNPPTRPALSQPSV